MQYKWLRCVFFFFFVCGKKKKKKKKKKKTPATAIKCNGGRDEKD